MKTSKLSMEACLRVSCTAKHVILPAIYSAGKAARGGGRHESSDGVHGDRSIRGLVRRDVRGIRTDVDESQRSCQRYTSK